ncbi:MAG: UDP-N-acetylglucosamine 1-carboxyvinyltransferase [Chloroflexi bacterium]|nr:MAG: UDP-N-acetylglucosamine 1-carboxyvinyltransferase [Chloroflexota bacterium]TMC28649.1 MAG: UDP-N-acetylglucosamine 1-carboxyvinyltransferase [Chloroflexota bacterium]TMC32166.1 MAG: UDP-N-acetylglucosamine 1-carboxyvinyltransferase [Chloroflexota bacterium]TMC57276.1 MAG: UDP-N-acetylglucosamine 1-carboxyvinyltransferase [Chloroflexota bacterium]
MARFIVEGGTPLRGEITPAGNKNEALPCIAAALLTDEPVTLRNVPRIRDVRNMLEIASALGAQIEDLDPHTVRITAKELKNDELPAALAKEIRPSLVFAAPLLARRKRARLGQPGGDVIGRRRVDSHFLALGELGATLDTSHGFTVTTDGLRGADVILDEASVTATENVLLAASVAKGRTVLRHAASEPHVQQLAKLLIAMGAKIAGIGTNMLTIDGVERMRGTDHTLLGDHMEIGSLIATAAMTHGEVTIKNVVPDHLRMTRLVFGRLGIDTEIRGNDVFVPARERYEIESDIGGAVPEVKPNIWPGFPTDLTSMAIAYATQAHGVVIVHEWMYDGRLFWVDTFTREMGARIILADPYRVIVLGPSELRPAEVRSPDIRAGMALLAATLCAKGKSVINNIEQIDRGYEALDERLRKLGAKIERAA